ncbi:hypothetical protein FISHEDRAFT_46792 [Fistulina hepatica ATCC 64428]|uniref:Uncharacterized protein n=1 Tax=Fistulina hepatica ATCC 64428 TaxID=1128425 RepID=A0A0D7A7F6_9AGAR|nr:hypothetical protein FISHEDRAFT_46792 [Fistulina hepatica ATCC 64428]
MLPRSVFIATPPKHDPPVSPPAERNFSRFVEASLSSTITDELTSTPLRVEPYQPRVPQNIDNIPDTPERRRTEEVYDRFLMASSGVVRVGKGYQSGVSVRGPISHTIGVANGATAVRDVPSGAIRGHLGFSSTRRQMPPPVSSDDVCRTASVDELGTILKRNAETPMPMSRDEPTSSTVARMRRALKVFAPGKTVSQRLSRMA